MEVQLEKPKKRSLKDIKRGNFFEIWEVDAPEKTSLIWSIMIPYLLSSAEIENFENSMQMLIGDNDEVQRLMNIISSKKKLNSIDIQSLIRRKNPLVDQQELYTENDLHNLMRIFKKRLDFLTNDLSRTTGKQYNDFLKLQAAANVLKRQINLFDENNVLFKTFIPDNLIEELVKNEDLILFVRSVGETNSFRYGVRNDYALYSRNKYLKHILKLAKIPSVKIKSIFNPHPSKQLLLQILQSPARDIVHHIYQSAFILETLSSAGYDMNPESKDIEGFSAFYHCLKYHDWALFLELYNYPTKSIHFSNIIENDHDHHFKALESFEVTITNDYENMKKDLSGGSLPIQSSYEQILPFISFHKDFLKKKNNIMKDPYSSNSDKAKKLLTLLIKEYDSHFYLHNNPTHQFEEYFSNYAYHEILDGYIILCFTDCFMSLGKIVDVNNQKSLEDALINLLKYFSTKVFFEKLGFKPSIGIPEEKTILFAYFCDRTHWKSSLDVLLKTLVCSYVDENKKTTQSILQTCMEKCPLLKEEYDILNLDVHFQIADAAYLFADQLNSDLVAERALYMIGETICSITDECTVTPLLRYYLPSDLEKAFCNLRNNCFAHYKASTIKGREAIEKGSDLNVIQEELMILYFVISPIFALQYYRVEREVLENCVEDDNISCTTQSLKFQIVEQSLVMANRIERSRERICSCYNDEYVHLLHKILECILQELKRKKLMKVKELRMRFEHLKTLLNYDKHNVKIWNICTNLLQLDVQMRKIFEQNATTIESDISQNMSNEILNLIKNIEKEIDSYESSIAQNSKDKKKFPSFKPLICMMGKQKLLAPFQANKRNDFLLYMSNTEKQILTTQLYQDIKQTFQELETKKITKWKELEIRFKGFQSTFTILEDEVKRRNIFHRLSQLVMQVDAIFEIHTTAIMTDVSQDLANGILNIFKDVEKIFDPYKSGITQKIENQYEFTNLKDLFNKIEKYEFFSPSEAEKIRDEFSKFLKRPFESRQRLIDHLNRRICLTTEEMNADVKTLFVPKKLREKIRKSLKKDPAKALLMIHDIKDTVEAILGKKEDTSYKFMKIFLDDMFIRRIKFLNLPLNLHEKIRNLHSQKLDFAIERLQYMKQVLTKGDQHLSKWLDNENKTLKEENYTKQLMVQRYANEIGTKAALETLLLDYLNIIHSNREFDEMKRKSSSLFCGINLRNILSHQCPVVEVSNKVLDDKNLANEFINKVYMYLEDLKSLVAMSDFYKIMNYPKKKKFEELVNDDTQDAYSHFRENIKSCKKWKRYLFLLPEK
ncbi:uncharacterized protein [Parasteatoda tepidariorum]|uniref:uncharacterized protein n=1 Tax=Parasteatoda tepidariorum TaxID=114398 RepID=UPI001C71A9C7|nr:uncharacterized protein LOC107447582 [Parasteatoda tepidariorum]XP_042910243.1 uncharacterized protein LOC107447582 [Parasteatoda tepidariorum]